MTEQIEKRLDQTILSNTEIRSTQDWDAIIQQRGELIIPIVEEQLRVEHREVVDGIVRITLGVQSAPQTVTEALYHEQVQVEHVPLNRVIETIPQVRYEDDGNTMVIPVVEEEVIVTKRYILREEIRVTKQIAQTEHTEQVALRRQTVNVERLPSSAAQSAFGIPVDAQPLRRAAQNTELTD